MLNVKKLLNKLINSNELVSEVFTHSVTVASNGSFSEAFDVTKEGYTPIAVQTWEINGTGQYYFSVMAMVLQPSVNTLYFKGRNNGTSSRTVDLRVTILYRKIV